VADRTFASMVTRINPSVPGCPQQTMIQYIRDAAIRTCERTLAWRYMIPLYELQPGVSEYPFNKPTNADVHAIFEALVNGRPLDRLTLEDALAQYPDWADLFSGESAETAWGETPPGGFDVDEFSEGVLGSGNDYVVPASIVADASTPRAICQLTPDMYIVLPLPDDAETYETRMFVALKPKRSATSMPEAILDELEEVIMHGALQHLLVLPSVHWSDRELATYHAKQYAFQISERRARANTGNARGTVRARMQPFGA